MNLYIKDGKGTLKRTEVFPITSMAIGKYAGQRIYYVPDDEFDNIMGELQQARTLPDPEDTTKKVNNEVVVVLAETGVIDCILRPDKWRDKDREDLKRIKEDKAKGIVLNILKKN